MKIPALVMASLLAVSVSGQSTKPVKKGSKPVKKIRKADSPKTVKADPKHVVKKDTILKYGGGCPACGMG